MQIVSIVLIYSPCTVDDISRKQSYPVGIYVKFELPKKYQTTESDKVRKCSSTNGFD